MITERNGGPFKGEMLGQLKAFLEAEGLQYDEAVTDTTVLMEEGRIIGTASLHGNIIKCVAVEKSYQGEGLTARLLTILFTTCAKRGITHLFLFTKPQNQAVFRDFGFYRIAETDQVLFMEHHGGDGGIKRFVKQLRKETREAGFEVGEGRVNGAVIMNCNPFTWGHRYLLEQAAAGCGLLHVFVVTGGESEIPGDIRFKLVKDGIADLDHVVVHRTGDYLISPATFPTYFIKDREQAGKANCRVDIEVFAQHVVPALGIRKRFVGTEPLCRVTRSYNEEMKCLLPQMGVAVVEIERKQVGGLPVSASRVRKLWAEWKNGADREEELKLLVPPATYDWLCGQSSMEN